MAYIHTGNFDDKVKYSELHNKTMTEFMRTYYNGVLIASGGYSIDEANNGIRNNEFDLVSIGKPFIANFDLIEKIKTNQVLTSYDVSMLNTLY